MSKEQSGVRLVETTTLGDVYELVNRAGMRAKIACYGGTVMALHVPDAKGQLTDVVLGHDKVES
jgi:hypothetical protein